MCAEETMTIDIDELKRDLISNMYGAYFGGEFGGAMVSVSDLERTTPEQIVEIAINQGIDLKKYQV